MKAIVKVEKTPVADFPYYVVGIFTDLKIKGFERRESAVEFADYVNREHEREMSAKI